MTAAFRDFAGSFEQWRLWSILAFNDIAQRYRGSILGPFWITLYTAAFVAGIGVVYGQLMHVPTEKYIPWMAAGVVIWNTIAATVSDGGDTFIGGAQLIRQTSIPLPLFLWRVIFRNMINFAHQIVVILGVAVWFHFAMRMNIPGALAGFILVFFNLSWIALFAAVVSARFRDVQQVIATVMQLMFFISPVLWIPSELTGTSKLNWINPFAHMLAVIRAPLLGLGFPLESVAYLLVMGVVGWAVTFLVYAFVRRRIVHYL
jgi:ABC-type polysaccharide/polyol phosphate export permease